jgi:hypothetical protein
MSKPAVECNDIDRNIRRARLAQTLGLQQGGREWRCVDRQPQARRQVDQRAKVILVRVREHDAENVAALLDEEAHIRQDEINARQVVARKRNPEVDGNPLPLAFVANPVEREVHADFARTAERREHKLLASPCHHPSPLPSAPFPKFVIHLSTL